MMRSAESDVPVGTVIDGKYRVDGIVGRGGMGTVYRAQHLALHEPVAIKILRRDAAQDEEIVTRFLREAQWVVKLRSEHVARVHDVGRTADGLPFMVMELLEGADLGQLVEQHGAMYAPVAVDLVLQSCDAIMEAHALGIVHRDIKPTNLYVSFRPDQTAIVKVLDFGISKAAGGTDMSLTQTQSMLGTPAYMSPEQMRSARDVDQRTDIWSLGTVLYELVEARRPFEAESFSEMCVMVAVDPPRPMVNAPELTPVVMRCLAKSPNERYANVAELMADLAPFANNPDNAHYFVVRAQRMVGRGSTPNIADTGPVALVTPAAMPIANLTMHGPRTATPSPTFAQSEPITMGPTRRDPRPRKTIWLGALAAILLGVGVAIAFVKSTEGVPPEIDTPPATTSPTTNAITEPVKDSAKEPVVEPVPPIVDAAVEMTTATATAPDKLPDVKKPPVVKKPPAGKKPPTVKKPPVPLAKPPLLKKCDPFDSRVRCS
jgi:serine/threonine protein kinase